VEEIVGRQVALQILLTQVMARMANASGDAREYVSVFRAETEKILNGTLTIAGDHTGAVRASAKMTAQEVFDLLIPPNSQPQ
jgi:hypothetical protein